MCNLGLNFVGAITHPVGGADGPLLQEQQSMTPPRMADLYRPVPSSNLQGQRMNQLYVCVYNQIRMIPSIKCFY